jgi:hypothetical protein
MATSFDLQLKGSVLILPQAWNGDANVTTADAQALDTAGAESVGVLFTTGAVTSGADIVIAFHEGDAANFTVASGNKIPDARIISSPAMDETANATYFHRFKANKRFIKAVVSRAGTHAAAICAIGVLGHLDNKPV